MGTPAAPCLGPVKIMFVDLPAGIALGDSIIPKSTTFQELSELLCRLSGSVIENLEGFNQIRLPGHGFSLNDGCWWYRIVTPAEGRNDDTTAVGAEKSSWKVLDNTFGYDYLIGQMTLGLTTQHNWIEFQHNLQKLRDEYNAKTACQSDVTCQMNHISDDGPGPALETPYVGPVIVNGGTPPSESSSNLEKFPDIEMPDSTYAGAYNSFNTHQQHFNYLPQNPPFNPMQATMQPAYQHVPVQQSSRFHHAQRGNYHQQPPNPTQWSLSQYRHQNGQFNHSFNRGNGRGRGRGGRDQPSFRQRPVPFSHQVGTPSANNYAKWNAMRMQEQQQDEEQRMAQHDAHYQSSFQTGSPNSGGRARARNNGIENSAKNQRNREMSSESETGNSPNDHAPKQASFAYGKNDARSTMSESEQMREAGSYHDYLQNYPQQFPSLANQNGDYQLSTFGSAAGRPFGNNAQNSGPDHLEDVSSKSTAWTTIPMFPNNPHINHLGAHQLQLGEDQSTLPDGLVFHPPIVQDTPNLFPDYDITSYNNGQPINTDVMKESEINAMSGHRSATSTNPSSKAPSRASNRGFSRNQHLPFPPHSNASSMHPSQFNRYAQPYGPMGCTRPTYAATYENADYFNHQLAGRLQPAQYHQLRLSPNQQEIGLEPVMSATIPTAGHVNDYNVKLAKKPTKGQKKTTKKQQQMEQQMEQETDYNRKQGASKPNNAFNFPPKLPKPGPPVGNFSPPKPRDIREEKAKKVFGIESTAWTKESGPTTNGNRNGSVKFSAGANRPRPSSRALSSATIKFGFKDMEGAERNHDPAPPNDTESDVSELTVLSRSPSPTPGFDASPATPGATAVGGTQNERAQRAKTAMANRAKEAKLREKMETKMQLEVEKQVESRAERAKRRASGRGQELGDMKGNEE